MSVLNIRTDTEREQKRGREVWRRGDEIRDEETAEQRLRRGGRDKMRTKRSKRLSK